MLISIPLISGISYKKCKECAIAVCDDDSIACLKCKKAYHWACSHLTDYEIKLHLRNPYKPWRCVSCVDKYCIHCNKILSIDNLGSVCCDKCSFWFHHECSGLDEHDFEHLCNTPDVLWTCPPCKQKICVRCNISTFNKPKTTCCLCKNLYHNVCVGLPKSKSNVSDWFCGRCRPSIFPFHNVDYKTLMKTSTHRDKYSLHNLTLLGSNMSRKCPVCSKVLSKSNPGIPCVC